MTENNQISDADKQKIFEALNNIRSQVTDHSLSNMIAEDRAKLVECRHEILIGVTAHVMEEDDEGKTIGSKEICKKNYHIPVPSDKDYHHYLEGFFNFLQQCMVSSVQQANENTRNTERTNDE